MTPSAAAQAGRVDVGRPDFMRLADPFRRELQAHCYRMLGSVHDAEDLVQETFLRAWRGYDRFEGRSSLRTWLHRIATTACLTAIEHRERRDLPAGLGGPSDDPEGPLAPVLPETTWLQPLPDSMFGVQPADPATVVAAREELRLAFVAALQYLPGRQRAVLLLRDVLRWRAAEVAELLGTTTAAVNSTLQRARAHLAEVAPAQDGLAEPADPLRRVLLERYVAAFENADMGALTRVLTDDATLEMRPFPTWVRGADAIARLVAAQCPAGPGDIRMLATAANALPAFAVYMTGHDGRHHAHSVHVLTVTAAGIAGVVAFLDPSLFAYFGLPLIHPSATGGTTRRNR
jgi:RNA polymerase sigma-70 factor (ECF subfamily)